MRTTALFALLGFLYVSAHAQENRPAVVAGYPVNYNEDSVGSYILPDVLTSNAGKKIITAKQWNEIRRPELLHLFETIEYGKMPPAPPTVQYNVLEKRGTAFNGKATRKQVTVYLDKDTSHKINLVIYLPAKISKPVPLLLNISFSPGCQVADDPAVRIGEVWNREGKKVKAEPAGRFPKMNIEQFADAGIGFATVYYGDIEPDFKAGIQYGIRSKYLKAGQTQPAADEWGAIAAWAWGLSRALDYFEQDKQVDAKRVALQGASRLGKTVLWAGAHDTRFKMVIASISGEGGAAITRRNYGETIRHITDTARYIYQFAANYHKYASDPATLPLDAHMLVALMAPRPLLLQTGSTDYWSDPKGEFISAMHAAPVYQLFGKEAPSGNMPAATEQSLLMRDLGYYMHNGGHTVLPEDWTLFISYMKKYL